MPPTVSFTPESVLKEAFEIIRKEGLSALTARKVAQNLGCSTQPVYSAFGSMKGLQDAVLTHAQGYAIEYLLRDPGNEEPFLAIGLQYFRFAREEPELFKILYLSPHTREPREDTLTPPLLVERMRLDPHLKNLDEEDLKRLWSNMWIYTHGLTTLSYDSVDSYSEGFVRRRLMEMGGILITCEQLRHEGIDLNERAMDCIIKQEIKTNQPE